MSAESNCFPRRWLSLLFLFPRRNKNARSCSLCRRRS